MAQMSVVHIDVLNPKLYLKYPELVPWVSAMKSSGRFTDAEIQIEFDKQLSEQIRSKQDNNNNANEVENKDYNQNDNVNEDENDNNNNNNVSMERKQQMLQIIKEHKKNSRAKSQEICCELFGLDLQKKTKDNQQCRRGKQSLTARYCSPHIRELYPQSILGDNASSEYCVQSRKARNECSLCHIDHKSFIKTDSINIAQAICSCLDGNGNKLDNIKRNHRLVAFMNLAMGTGYPDCSKDCTKLRIKVNQQVWIEYYIKLSPYSSLLKTSAPSGYKVMSDTHIYIYICVSLHIMFNLV